MCLWMICILYIPISSFIDFHQTGINDNFEIVVHVNFIKLKNVQTEVLKSVLLVPCS